MAAIHLEGAILSWAHLEGAELYMAYLSRADLYKAHLEGASLRKAHLEGASLRNAHLEGKYSLFGPDLARFVREGNTRGLFKGREVFNLLGGEPEYLDPLKAEAPTGWYVTGYPWYGIRTPAHEKFLAAYQKRWNDYPRAGSVVGYSTILSAVAVMKAAGSLDSEKLAAAMEGLSLDMPFGRITYRAIDHQSTMGAYVGRSALRDGKGVMTAFHYADGAKFQPSDAEVKKLRPE